ncbi:MAG: N-acetylglucosamine-6-phosphate deacetylase [Chitinophagaceae bacterium]|nr:N-acetylglucosamine-6-phosphate deacetylase [Chitinophagaceae bacterium]
MAAKAYIAKHIFTGEQWLHEHAAIVVDGMITDVLPVSALDTQMEAVNFDDHILAPAFIDLQLYGAYEKLFSVYPDTDSLQSLNKYSSNGGAAFCMPTVATNQPEVFFQCIDAIRLYWQQGGEGILGLHAEGPWINKVKRGAHIESLIHSPSLQEVEALIDYGKDVIKIITLAPEVCSKEVINLIHASGIKIFAGHSNATYEEAIQSFDNGIAAVTHLYNAMSPLQHRSPGLVGAAFDHQQIKAGIIADGYHVDYAAIRIAKKIMQQRLFAITDAVTKTTEGYYQHQPEGDKYTADNILSGSALTMYKALQNLVNHVGIETGEALRMCSLYPAQVMQIDNQLGRIATGYKAKMAVMPALLNDTDVQIIS